MKNVMARALSRALLLIALLTGPSALGHALQTECDVLLYSVPLLSQEEREVGHFHSLPDRPGSRRHRNWQTIFIEGRLFRYDPLPLSSESNTASSFVTDDHFAMKVYKPINRRMFFREVVLNNFLRRLGFPVVPIVALDREELILVKPFIQHETSIHTLGFENRAAGKYVSLRNETSRELIQKRQQLLADVLKAYVDHKEELAAEFAKYDLSYDKIMSSLVREMGRSENTVYVTTPESVQLWILDP